MNGGTANSARAGPLGSHCRQLKHFRSRERRSADETDSRVTCDCRKRFGFVRRAAHVLPGARALSQVAPGLPAILTRGGCRWIGNGL